MLVNKAIDLVKFFYHGSNGQLGLKEAKELLDAMREGKTVHYTLRKVDTWPAFKRFLAEEPIRVEMAKSKIELLFFNGNESQAHQLETLICEYMRIEEYQGRHAVDGLRFGRRFVLEVPLGSETETKRLLEQFAVEYVMLRVLPQGSPRQESPEREIPTETNHTAERRCLLTLVGEFYDKIACIKLLRECLPEKDRSLVFAKQIVDDLSVNQKKEVFLDANCKSTFVQEIAQFNIKAVFL